MRQRTAWQTGLTSYDMLFSVEEIGSSLKKPLHPELTELNFLIFLCFFIHFNCELYNLLIWRLCHLLVSALNSKKH